ncbi:MAG: adenylate/guanylate cyclase domain-containing protein [Anaerolineae bacterium]|nr:adenylate/guanylate cyclase domain-containing protein [Anaerolineae bacterium]
MYREFLGERVPSALFAQWRGRPLYIHVVFLLGQLLITFGPIFPILVFFNAFVTRLEWTVVLMWGGGGLLVVVLVAAWLYLYYSRAIRRFLALMIAGELVEPPQATAAWLEAVLFPQRMVGWAALGIVVVFGLEIVFLIPHYGLQSTLQSGIVVLTGAIWFGMVIFLFYLEGAMRPIVRLALATGAEPVLDNLGIARLRLGTKLQVLTLALIVVPTAIVGIFAYSQVVALGGDPGRVLLLTGLIVAIAGGAAVLQSFLLVRSVLAPMREIQRVIDEVARGNLDVSVRTMTTDELAELGLQFNRMVVKLHQNEALAAAFGRYVSPTVRDGILSGQIDLGGERREITILFTDIRDFTGWCERESPESVIQTLNVYYGFLVQTLIRHGGTVTRYTGDGVLALFGAPLDDPDHALHAVQAVWESYTLLEKFNDIRRTLGAFELRTGFGIHTGSAVVGSIGTDARAEYTPIGDPANVASRIEGLNKELSTSVLISEATYRRVVEHVLVGQRAEVTVKGRSRPVRVVELVGLKPTPRLEQG